jgi:hypothetical protein
MVTTRHRGCRAGRQRHSAGRLLANGMPRRLNNITMGAFANADFRFAQGTSGLPAGRFPFLPGEHRLPEHAQGHSGNR